jgi:hypothetical protein
MSRSWYHNFECGNQPCVECGAVTVRIRANTEHVARTQLCPLCHLPMDFRNCEEVDEVVHAAKPCDAVTDATGQILSNAPLKKNPCCSAVGKRIILGRKFCWLCDQELS